MLGEGGGRRARRDTPHGTDEICVLQSTIVIAYLIENGFHGPAKRELRFILEAGVKFLAGDQALKGSSLKEKNAHLSKVRGLSVP